MFVNNWLIISLGLFIAIISIQQHSALKHNIKRSIQPDGKGNLNKNPASDSSSSSISSPSSSSNKRYSNKEFVFDEDEDDESEEQKISPPSQAQALFKASSNKAEKSMYNNNNNKFDPVLNKISNDLNENNLADLADSIDMDHLERNQRTDQKHKNHNSYLENLKEFHKNVKLQKELLALLDDRYNIDYDDLLDSMFQKNTKQFENEMKNQEIGDILSSMKSNQDKQGFLSMLDEEDMKNLNLQAKNHIEKVNKPVNVIDFKEKIYSEKDYNKQLKTQSPESNIDLNLANSQVLSGLDDKKESNSVNSLPAMAIKQSNGVQDPSINTKIDQMRQQNDYLFIFVFVGCTLAIVVAFVAAGVCWYTVHRNSKAAAANVEYGVKKSGLFETSTSGSVKSNSGDRRLAQSAQMYHYQHQKQQMIAMEKANTDTKADNSDNSDGETEEGDYTVYECPGLAPTGEMEVKNPLFKEDFAVSSNNIYASASSMPPAYSTVANKENEEVKTENLVDIDASKADKTNTTTETK